MVVAHRMYIEGVIDTMRVLKVVETPEVVAELIESAVEDAAKEGYAKGQETNRRPEG